jgi:hypothetical protein
LALHANSRTSRRLVVKSYSTEAIRDKMVIISTNISQDLVESKINAKSNSVELYIIPRIAHLYCSLCLICYEFGFDVTFDEKISLSDLSYDIYDFESIIEHVSLGYIEICEYLFLKLKTKTTVCLFNIDPIFITTMINFPMPDIVLLKRCWHYDSFAKQR